MFWFKGAHKVGWIFVCISGRNVFLLFNFFNHIKDLPAVWSPQCWFKHSILHFVLIYVFAAHNVGYLCISVFFCHLNHIKTAVESTMLCVCFCKNVVEMCCRYEFLCIYFFKITIAYILQDLPLQPAMVLVYLFQKVYILAKLSHIFNFLSMKVSCDLNILYILHLPLI